MLKGKKGNISFCFLFLFFIFCFLSDYKYLIILLPKNKYLNYTHTHDNFDSLNWLLLAPPKHLWFGVREIPTWPIKSTCALFGEQLYKYIRSSFYLELMFINWMQHKYDTYPKIITYWSGIPSVRWMPYPI